jgi:hypothetical protein
MVKEVTRHIKLEDQRELWARAAGRCQFDGCNKIVYQSPVTKEAVNIGQQAHIYSFSEDGPRGWGIFKSNKENLNKVENLMLMCHACHVTIDKDKNGEKYSANILQKWKQQHEERIYIVTGIASTKKTHVVFYGANISEQLSPVLKNDAHTALFPDHYPVDEAPIRLSMTCSHEDKSKEFWQSESTHLSKIFSTQIEPRIADNNPAHFSLFALAPMPLLIKLGALFTDKISVDVYQPIREPKTWRWQSAPNHFDFNVSHPTSFAHPPVLVMSLSAKIDHQRVKDILGENITIWEISVDDAFCHNDFIKSPEQLSKFRESMRKLIAAIKEKHGIAELSVFPAIPVSCAVEMGRIRMPKADMPWVIYDQNLKAGKFIRALQIGETNVP